MARGDVGWAYVAQDFLSSSGGSLGSIQFKQGTGISGSGGLVYDYATTTLVLSGNLNVSGAISANSFNLDVTNKTVTNLSATGSTKFGDSVGDHHYFTGSMHVTASSHPLRLYGLQTGSAAGPGSYLVLDSNSRLVLSTVATVTHPVTALNNQSANRLVSIGSTTTELDGEANLTFDGSILSVTGHLSSSVGISSSLGQYTVVTSSAITDGTLKIAGGNITSVAQISATGVTGTLGTAAQPNITSVGTLTSLTVDSTTFRVNDATSKVGIGRTAPDKKLEIVDNSSDQLRVTHTAGTKYTDFKTNSGGYFSVSSSHGRVGIQTKSPTAALAVSGTTHLSGNVGINTTTPMFALDVSGSGRITGNLEITGTLKARTTDFQISANTLTFGDAGTDTIVFNAATASVTNGLNIDANTLVIDSSNNRIGIGAQFPSKTLHVQSTTTQLQLSYDNSNNTTFTIRDNGDLNIQPSGAYITASSDLFVSGNVKLGFDSTTTVNVPGRLTASVNLSSSLGTFTALTSSAITNRTITLVGGNITGVSNITATQVAATGLTGTLATAAQTNITSVGTLTSLTVDSTTLKVNSVSNKVGIGRTAPDKKLEIVDSSDSQLRLTHTAGSKFADLKSTSDGYLLLTPSHNNVGIGTTRPTANLAISGNIHISASTNPIKFHGINMGSATTGSFLALDENNNLILTSSGTVITEYVSASILTYTNHGDNRIITSVNSASVNGEANLTFDGTDLKIAGGGDLYTDQIRRMSDSSTTTKINLEDEVIKLYAGHSSNEVVKVQSGTITIVGTLTGSQANASVNQLTSSTALITEGTITQVIAAGLTGTLATAAQPNITSVGTLTSLTVDSTTLKVNNTSNRVGVGRTAPQRKLDVLDGGGTPQFRLSHDATKYSEMQTTSNGTFNLSSSGGRIEIESTTLAMTGAVHISASTNTLRLSGLQSGSIAGPGSYLGVSSTGQIVLTASSGGGGTVTIANDADNRLTTAGGDGSINGESNLTFDGSKLLINGGLILKRRTVITHITASADDFYFGVAQTASLDIRLPNASTLTSGQTYVVKDEGGNAGTHKIKIKATGAQTIDGDGSVVLKSAYAAIHLYTNGSDKYFIY